jgi:hypothetical protein
MAMLNVQKNLAANGLAVTIAMYASENMAALTDTDYAELAEFSHVTVAEMTAARNALNEINTAMGEFVAGSAVTRLMRILNRVPE